MEKFQIEVVYGNAEEQSIIPLWVEPGTTAREAILQSGILEEWPEINLDHCAIGIFGKLIPLDELVQNQDRIEIYRPLFIDPKQARKLRIRKNGWRAGGNPGARN